MFGLCCFSSSGNTLKWVTNYSNAYVNKTNLYTNSCEIIYHGITFYIRSTPTTVKLICHIQLCSHLKTHNAAPFALFLPLLFSFSIPTTFQRHICIHSSRQAYFTPALFAKEATETQPTNKGYDICTGVPYSLRVFCGKDNVNWLNDDKMSWVGQIKS